MALSLQKQCERARAKWDATSTVFNSWAIASGFGNVRRSEMAKVVADLPEGAALLAADNAARAALEDTERAAVAAACAWRGPFGSVSFYSAADQRRFAAQRRRSAS